MIATVISLQAQHRLTAEFGGGVAVPIGDTNQRAKVGFSFAAAAGPRLTNRFSALLDFTFHGLDVNALENSSGNPRVDAQMYLWSLTANPDFQFIKTERFSSYVTGGYGLYYRWLELTRADFGSGVVCDAWWSLCSTPFNVDGNLFNGIRSTYKGGVNAGGGFTYGTNKKFFAEVRYHRMFTTRQPTELLPIIVGVRW
jgi:opacity protein-like surface antigen